MAIDRELLEILVCPACHGAVEEVAEATGLGCGACGRVYPIRDGIPVMLVDEASAPTRDAASQGPEPADPAVS